MGVFDDEECEGRVKGCASRTWPPVLEYKPFYAQFSKVLKDCLTPMPQKDITRR